MSDCKGYWNLSLLTFGVIGVFSLLTPSAAEAFRGNNIRPRGFYGAPREISTNTRRLYNPHPGTFDGRSRNSFGVSTHGAVDQSVKRRFFYTRPRLVRH